MTTSTSPSTQDERWQARHPLGVVAARHQLAFMPRLFGPTQYLTGESAVYGAMAKACPAWHGWLWEQMLTPHGNRYLRPGLPRADVGYRLIGQHNFAEVRVSADGAGLAITLLVLHHLTCALTMTGRVTEADYASERYESLLMELHETGHRDWPEILAFLA